MLCETHLNLLAFPQSSKKKEVQWKKPLGALIFVLKFFLLLNAATDVHRLQLETHYAVTNVGGHVAKGIFLF